MWTVEEIDEIIITLKDAYRDILYQRMEDPTEYLIKKIRKGDFSAEYQTPDQILKDIDMWQGKKLALENGCNLHRICR